MVENVFRTRFTLRSKLRWGAFLCVREGGLFKFLTERETCSFRIPSIRCCNTSDCNETSSKLIFSTSNAVFKQSKWTLNDDTGAHMTSTCFSQRCIDVRIARLWWQFPLYRRVEVNETPQHLDTSLRQRFDCSDLLSNKTMLQRKK